MRNTRGGSDAPFTAEFLESRTLMSISIADIPAPVFTAPAGHTIQLVQDADIDGDGDLDILLTYGGPSGAKLVTLRNRGGGAFRVLSTVELPSLMPRQRPASTSGLIIADFDGDGDADLAIAGERSTFKAPGGREVEASPRLWLIENRGTGSRFALSDSAKAAAAWSAAQGSLAIDLDGDGGAEIIDANLNVFDVGDSRITPRGPAGGLDGARSLVGAADLDDDGDTDLIARRFVGTTVSFFLLRNDGAGGLAAALVGEFADVQAALYSSQPDWYVVPEYEPEARLVAPTYGGATARLLDLDGDGALDLALGLTIRPADASAGPLGPRIEIVGFRNNLTPAGGGFADAGRLNTETFDEILARDGQQPGNLPGVMAEIVDLRDVNDDGRPDALVAIRLFHGFSISAGSTRNYDSPTWTRRYDLALAPTSDALPPGEGLPEFEVAAYAVPEDLRVEPFEQRVGSGVLLRSDLDGDGAEDFIIRRGITDGRRRFTGRALYIDLAARAAPRGWDLAAGDLAGTFDRAIGTDGAVRGRVSFDAPIPGQDGAFTDASEISVFIDSNRNGRLDAADALVTERQSRAGTFFWRFTARRDASWGQGFTTLFTVARSAEGSAGVPITTPLWLRAAGESGEWFYTA